MNESRYHFFRSIGSPKYHLAPMVEYSEIAFRMLVRKYGVECCYGPMLNAGVFVKQDSYRKEHFDIIDALDRPLIAQFAGDDPDVMLKAAKYVEDKVDAIDVNFGCPQRIAKRGHYGAFLQEEPEVACSLMRILSEGLNIPVTAKIRIQRSALDTIAFALGLVQSGASMICVHGRLREWKGLNDTDWDMIKRVRQALPDVPVIGNGGVISLKQSEELMKESGVDGVMSSRSLLSNPATFFAKDIDLCDVDFASEYVEFAKRYHTPNRVVKGHLFKLLANRLRNNVDVRLKLHHSKDYSDQSVLIETLKERIRNNIPPVLEVEKIGKKNSKRSSNELDLKESEAKKPMMES